MDRAGSLLSATGRRKKMSVGAMACNGASLQATSPFYNNANCSPLTGPSTTTVFRRETVSTVS